LNFGYDISATDCTPQEETLQSEKMIYSLISVAFPKKLLNNCYGQCYSVQRLHLLKWNFLDH